MTSTGITAAELAAMISVNPRTIQRWARKGRITHFRNGRTMRFLPEHVEAFLEANTRMASEQRPEADIANDRFASYVTVVPMRRPGDAA